MTLHAISFGKSFLKDRSGNFTMLFAAAAPIILIAAGAAIDYSHTISLRSEAQATLDSAALAATTAYAQGNITSASAAQTYATNFFKANAPAAITGSQTCLTASVVPPASGSGVVATQVNYCGSFPSLLGGLVGSGAQNVNLSASSQATITTTTTTTTTNTATAGAGKYAGNGDVLGDPHVLGADGSDYYFACALPSGSWYNMLSDSGIEINVNCNVNSLFNMDAIQNITTLLGTHTLQMTTVDPTSTNVVNFWVNGEEYASGNVSYPNGSWVGAVTIDGVVHAAKSGTNTYLNDTAENVKVSVTVGQPGVASSAYNYVTITTADYSIMELYYNAGMGYIQIVAKNAGKCGVPGGIWGGTLAGHDDPNGADFLISGPTYTAPQFLWTNCLTTTSSTTTAETKTSILTK